MAFHISIMKCIPRRTLVLTRRTRRTPVRCAPSWNPQNVPDPKVLPSPSFTPEECVRKQMEAIQINNDPWVNHGIQTFYEFAADAGGMERSKYFGFSKDLYHFDHFLGTFQTSFGDLISCLKFEIGPVTNYDDELKRVEVKVVDKDGVECGPFAFLLESKKLGRRRGSWMTKAILRRPPLSTK